MGTIFTIILVTLIALYLLYLLLRYLYRKKKGLPVGECAECSSKKDWLVKEYRKKYSTKKK